MTFTRANAITAGIIALANSVIPFLCAIKVVTWPSTTQGLAETIIVNAVTVGGLIFASTPASNTPPTP